MILTVNILKELDEKIEEDFDNYPPAGIPKDNEWQMSGIGELFFNSEKKKKASQRTVFNFGVMTGLADYYFDGKTREFDKFLEKAVFSAVQSPKMVMKAQKFCNKFPKEFSTGVKWSKHFRTRYDLSENQDSTHKIDDPIYSVENKTSHNNPLSAEIEKLVQSFIIGKYEFPLFEGTDLSAELYNRLTIENVLFEDVIEFGDEQVLNILKMMDLVLSGFNLLMTNCDGDLGEVLKNHQESVQNSDNFNRKLGLPADEPLDDGTEEDYIRVRKDSVTNWIPIFVEIVKSNKYASI